MIIHFVRHGHPNYKDDCLTDLGKKQAEAAAERLLGAGIEQIYSSTRGRAFETAEYTAARLGLSVIPAPFMCEISWKPLEGEEIIENGHPWRTSRRLAASGVSLANPDWQKTEPYTKSTVVDSTAAVARGFDDFLASHGYLREGDYYRVVGEETDKTIAIFSHGGSSAAALSHLLNVPFPLLCGSFMIDYTSITTLSLPNERDTLVFPRLTLLNDARHIEGITVENVFDN